MDFGITLATATDSWKVVQRAEELGFTYAWFYDTQMLNADPFVAMAAAAMQTHTINLGTGVLVPSNRRGVARDAHLKTSTPWLRVVAACWRPVRPMIAQKQKLKRALVRS